MSIGIRITLNEGLYLRDPQDSTLGMKILEHGVLLIDNLGFERFTFRKLAAAIHSTEASVYRYFENKHKLLLYLVAWYWEWVAYLIKMNTKNITDPKQKLRIIINSFVSASKENLEVVYINESILHDVVISEGMKAYHTKEVDKENDMGLFTNYNKLTESVSRVISEIDPDFKYPAALSSNLFEMSNNHIYFAKHMPKLTEVSVTDTEFDEVEKMLNYFTEKLLY